MQNLIFLGQDKLNVLNEGAEGLKSLSYYQLWKEPSLIFVTFVEEISLPNP